MSYIELVIKVDEKDVDFVRKYFRPPAHDLIPLNIQTEFVSAILNGTPLPEHHGRLIDADAIIAEATEKMKYPSNYEYMECVIAHMNLAPTIIEADKCCTYKETGCGSCKRQLDCPIEADKEVNEWN